MNFPFRQKKSVKDIMDLIIFEYDTEDIEVPHLVKFFSLFIIVRNKIDMKENTDDIYKYVERELKKDIRLSPDYNYYNDKLGLCVRCGARRELLQNKNL